MTKRTFYVYIMSSQTKTIYVGVTNDLERRVSEHKAAVTPGFTAHYNVRRLVHFEEFSTPADAIEREKEIKGWARAKKIALIESENPSWKDLSVGRME